MGVIEDYLNHLGIGQRLQEHYESQQPRDIGDLVKRLLTFAPQRDTLGLAFEGTGSIAKAGAGELGFAAAGAQEAAVRAGLADPNAAASRAAHEALMAGPGDPGRIQDIYRNSDDSLLAWLAGALEMATDPTNVIAGPVGKASEVNTLAAKAAREGARAGLSDEFLKAGREATHGGVANDLMAQLQHYTEGDEVRRMFADQDNQQALLQKLRQPPDEGLAEFRNKLLSEYNAKEPLDTSPLEAMLANAGETYKGVAAQKQAAETPIARQMLTTTGPRGGKVPLKRGAISDLRANPTPEYLKAVDEAKTAATPQGPGLPRRGQTPGQYKAELRGMLDRVRAEDEAARDEIMQLMLKPEKSALTPEEADQLIGPLDKRGMPVNDTPMPDQGLGALNAQFNAAELASANPQPELTAALGEGGGTGIMGPQPKVPSAPTDFGGPPQFAGAVTRPQQIETEIKNVVEAPALDGSNPVMETFTNGRMWDLIKYALQQGWAEEKAAFNRPMSKMPLSKQLGSVWSGINIETPRNIFMDKIYSNFLLRNEGIRKNALKTNEQMITSRLVNGETKPHLLFGSLGDILTRLGKAPADEKELEAFSKQLMKEMGGNFFEIEADIANQLDDMNLLQQAGMGLVTQLATPTRAATGLLTAPGNLLIPMRRKVFHIINNVTHTAARVAAFEDAFAPFIKNSADDLLERAAREGMDVSALRGKVLKSGDDVIASEGGFSVDEVRKVLGERYAKEWDRASDLALKAGYERSKSVLGNYQLEGTLGNAERMIRKFVPFMSWSWRAYPRAAKYALQHPAVAAAVLHLYAADRAQAEAEGRPGYQVGTLSIKNDTPFLGLLASAFTPEQEAELRFNPLALFTPVGGELLGVGMDQGDSGEEKTGYQKAADVLKLAGGSFNPYVQSFAYLTGQDRRAPGNASRYSPIDQYIGNESGIEAPTIQGPLRAARAAITEALGDKQVDNYDPVVAKANELVMEATGKPISDESNKAIALDIRNKGQVYKEAEKLLLAGNARKASFNALSPQSVMATSQTKVEERKAGKEPFSYEDIKLAQEAGLPAVVKAMQAANEDFFANNPAAAVQNKPKFTDKELMDPRLARWESQNATLKRLAPKSYAAARKEFIATLGIR